MPDKIMKTLNGYEIYDEYARTDMKEELEAKINNKANSSHNHSASEITSGTLGVARGGTGATTHTSNAVLTGNGTSAVKNVSTANGALYATSTNGAAQFGTLPLAQGGTGATSATNARSNLDVYSKSEVDSKISSAGSSITVDSALSSTSTNPVQNKVVNSALSNKANSSHNHAASEITSGTLGVARGGTGATTLTSKAVLLGNGTNAVSFATNASGALYSTGTSGTPKFGTLPVAQGGTGATSASAARTSLDVYSKSEVDNKVSSAGSSITVDSALSSTSTNPVQNKVVNSALSGKADSSHNHTGLQAVTTAGTGDAYTATVSGITSLTKGVNFIMIPHTSSTTKTPTLNVNGLGAKTIQRYVSANDYSTEGYNTSWLQSTRPVLVIYSGTYWYVQAMDKPAAYDLRGTVPIASGGTGATDASTARTNLEVYSKTEVDNKISSAGSGSSGSYLPTSGGTISGNLTVSGTTTLAKLASSSTTAIQATAPVLQHAITATCSTATTLGTSLKKLTLGSNYGYSWANTTTGLFSISNGGIKCNFTGVVMVTAEMYCSGITAGDNIGIRLYRNSTSSTTTSWAFPNSTYGTVHMIPKVQYVTSGDVLYLYGQNYNRAAGSIVADNNTYMTVWYIG